MNDQSFDLDREARETPEAIEERRRRLRGRNLALLFGLFALVLLFYGVTVARMGGH